MSRFFESFETILERMNNRMDRDIDKREGSVTYDANAASAFELELMSRAADFILDNAFADTAGREFLIKLAIERGIAPKPATYAHWKGVFDKEISIGDRFSLEGEEANFVVQSALEGQYAYLLRCETPGEIGNLRSGRLIPLQNNIGLQSAYLTDLLIPGEEDEETEAFRERYMDTLKYDTFGGNIIEYKVKTNALDGVGAVKVEPAWQGGGSVQVVFVDSEFNAPTPQMVDKIQEIIDPVPYGGLGMGQAPIDHRVTVQGATFDTVSIHLNLAFGEGHSWSTVKGPILETIENYFKELRAGWGSRKNLPMSKETPVTVRVSQIEIRVLEVPGVIDAYDTMINGKMANYALEQTKTPKLGVVTA